MIVTNNTGIVCSKQSPEENIGIEGENTNEWQSDVFMRYTIK